MNRLLQSLYQRESNAKPKTLFPAFYLLFLLALALPALLHLPALFSGHYFFYQSLFTGRASPSPWVRLADCLWITLCLLGLIYCHTRLEGGRKILFLVLGLAGYLVVPPFGSADCLFYFSMVKGWVTAGLDPYHSSFSVANPYLFDFPTALVYQHVPYPPLWVIAAGGLFRLSCGHLLAFIVLLKSLLLALHLGNFILLRRIWIRLYPQSDAGAIAWLYLLCPFFLLEGLAMMHFDLVWLFLCLLAVDAAVRQRMLPAALAWSAAFWTKYSALFCLPLFLPLLLEKDTPLRRRIARLTLLVGSWAVVGTMALLPFQHWSDILKGAVTQANWVVNSLPTIAFVLSGARPAYLPALKWILLAAAIAALAFIRPRPDLRSITGALAFTSAGSLVFLLLASPLYWPWYSVWPLLFSMLLVQTRWGYLYRVSLLFATLSFLYYPLQYLPGHAFVSSNYPFQAWYALLSHLIPLGALFWYARGQLQSTAGKAIKIEI